MRSAGSGWRVQPRSATSATTQPSAHISHFRRRYLLMRCSRSVGNEDVALVAYGPDEPRMLGIRLDLLAQAHDAQVHAAVKGIQIAAVDIQDALAGKRAIGVLRERL